MRKFSLFAFVGLFILYSCTTSKGITSSVDNRNIENAPLVNTHTDQEVADGEDEVAKDTLVQIDEMESDTSDFVIAPNKYNIAVVLPFMFTLVADDYNLFLPDTNIYLSADMKESLDFYIGLKLAIEDFKTKEKDINFFMLDIGNNESKAKQILSDRPFPEVNIIVSGSSNRISNEILRYSKEQEIPVISPFTSEIPYVNEFFHAAQPNLNRYIESALVEAVNKYPDYEVEVFQDSNNDSSRIITNSIKGFLADNIGVNANVIQSNSFLHDSYKIDSLSASKIAIVASNKETVVKRFLSKLNERKNKTHVIGTPAWKEFDDLKTYENLVIYIPVLSKPNKSSTELEIFSDRIKNVFKVKPNKNQFLGYDLIAYIINLIAQDKLAYDMVSSQDLNLKPYYYNFDFIPITDGNGIRYFTNDQIKTLIIEGEKK